MRLLTHETHLHTRLLKHELEGLKNMTIRKRKVERTPVDLAEGLLQGGEYIENYVGKLLSHLLPKQKHIIFFREELSSKPR